MLTLSQFFNINSNFFEYFNDMSISIFDTDYDGPDFDESILLSGTFSELLEKVNLYEYWYSEVLCFGFDPVDNVSAIEIKVIKG